MASRVSVMVIWPLAGTVTVCEVPMMWSLKTKIWKMELPPHTCPMSPTAHQTSGWMSRTLRWATMLLSNKGQIEMEMCLLAYC